MSEGRLEKTDRMADHSTFCNHRNMFLRVLAILLGFGLFGFFIGLGISRLRQPFRLGNEIDFGHERVVVLKNQQGIEVHILSLGGIVQKLLVPDSQGNLADIVLGFDDIEPYKDGTSPYFGAVVGRVANRIANATFSLDGKQYNLSANDPPNSLHGGVWGFSRRTWEVLRSELHDDGSQSVTLAIVSKSGDEGFPGKVQASVKYSLKEPAALHIEFEAQTDSATPINLAQHTYFNLDGVDEAKTILDHTLQINSTCITPVDKTRIPTGEYQALEDTPFDFRQSKRIGADISSVPGGEPVGYDINYVLWGRDESAVLAHTKKCLAMSEPALAAKVHSPSSGRTLEVLTNSPGLQFYSGNQLDGSLIGKGGVVYEQYGGFALETQVFPNFVNEAHFPDCTLREGERYLATAIWRFSVEE